MRCVHLGGAIRVILAAAVVTLCGGCLSGSLATSTGPRAGGPWSVAREQEVHSGETVKFSFVLTDPAKGVPVNAVGLADYLILRVGDDRLDVEPDIDGRFGAEYSFEDIPVGERVRVEATAMREYGDRDAINIQGEWIKTENGLNDPDMALASDALWMRVYRTGIRIAVPAELNADDLDFGMLVLTDMEDHKATVLHQEGDLHGFSFEKRTDEPGWWIVYEPLADEVGDYGQTRVEFVCRDTAGRDYRFESVLNTP